MSEEDRKKRNIIIGIVAAVVVIIIISVIAIIDRARHSVTLEVAVAPKASTLTLNGKKIENGTYHLLPGTYEISLTMDGMEPYFNTVEMLGGATYYLYKYLTGPDGDLSWYYEHPEDAMIFNTIGDYEANEKAKKYASSDPIFAVTPYYDIRNNHFKISVKYDDDNKIVVTVNLNTCTELLRDKYIEEANQYLSNKGLQLDNYKMNYVGLCDSN